jgi:hypothetical protein
MKKQTALRRSLLAAALTGVIAFSGPALAIEINEVEPNSGAFVVNALQVSQVLSEPGDLSVATQGATVYGRIGLSPTKIAPEVDVYSFYAEAGTIVTIHLEAPTGGLLSFDPILTLFTPKPSSERREISFPTQTKDAIIENYPLDITGSWQVIVSPHRHHLHHRWCARKRLRLHGRPERTLQARDHAGRGARDGAADQPRDQAGQRRQRPVEPEIQRQYPRRIALVGRVRCPERRCGIVDIRCHG